VESTRPAANGRERKSLAEHIDRLDGILDGLSEVLAEGVGEAVKEAVAAVDGDMARRRESLRPAGPAWWDRLRRVAGRAAALVHDVVAWATQKARDGCVRVNSAAEPLPSRIGGAAGRAVSGPSRGRWRLAWPVGGSLEAVPAHRDHGGVVLLAGVSWILFGPFASGLVCGGLATLTFAAVEGLIWPRRPSGPPPEPPGDCIPRQSGDAADLSL